MMILMLLQVFICQRVGSACELKGRCLSGDRDRLPEIENLYKTLARSHRFTITIGFLYEIPPYGPF
jgi:hypothetical protein